MRDHPLVLRWPAALTVCVGVILLFALTPWASPSTDLDALMARVLERRDENWRRLHEYVLSERERLDIRNPEDQPLHGERREFIWYIRDGYFIRSPVRLNGVTIGGPDRRAYEARWLKEEQQREKKAAAKSTEASPSPGADDLAEVDPEDEPADVQALVSQRVEPRFISHAYFLDFTFEPGNYYFAGRETLEGRDVLRIEYYPTRLFDRSDEETPSDEPPLSTEEREFIGKLNRVALITLWVDPHEEQIVKFTFDNTGYEFFPLRWLVRVEDVSASMVMAPLLQGFWVPQTITAHASFTAASGTYEVDYGREFFEYRKAETRARFRGVVER